MDVKNFLLACCGVLIIGSLAEAQSFNLRFSHGPPAPAPTYGAAIDQAGTWNAVATGNPFSGVPATTDLVDLAGALTGVQVDALGCDTYPCAVTGYGPDVEALFAAALNGDCYLDPSSITLRGLQEGDYMFTVYGSSCTVSDKSVSLTLGDGSYSKIEVVGGIYDGGFSGMKLAIYVFFLPAGVEVTLRGTHSRYMSAMQATRFEPAATYCTAKVTSHGCAASIVSGGDATASLSAPGSFVVGATGLLTDVQGVFFFGHAQAVHPFQGGLLCVQPPTTRTPLQDSGNQGSACSGAFGLDFNAWLQSGAGPAILPGSELFGQYWYRDPADPAGFGAATSDALRFWVLH